MAKARQLPRRQRFRQALLFVSSLFLGKLWCGWACPAGALQEFGAPINNRPAPGGTFDRVKWAIWVPWIGVIVVMVVRAGGYHAVDPFYHFETGVTVALPVESGDPSWYMIYYIIVILFLALAVIFGRRAGCHSICWMAPFLVPGRRIWNLGRWPALRLRAESDKCIDCRRCTRDCPMSLDVNGMVNVGDIENDECILCGTCVNNCPEDVIRFSFSSGR
jgi:ferredoxin-type protein NapH